MTGVDRSLVFGETEAAIERIAPGFFPKALEEEHIARYRWASRWCAGARVLDVACGTGYGAEILRKAGAAHIISVDRAMLALHFGKARYSLTALCADAHRLPLRDGSFDVIVALETIEHLPKPLQFLKECARVLRQGGLLVLSTPNAEQSDGSNPYHVHEMTLDELRSGLRAAGFSLTGLWGQHWTLRGRLFTRIRGFRRLAWEVYRRSRVMRSRTLAERVAMPQYLCVTAAKQGLADGHG